MESQLVAPYVVSHVVAVIYVLVAWRGPAAAPWVTGFGFVVAGAFNLWTANTTPQVYVEGFAPYAFAPYREFILGTFARHTKEFVTAIACGQMMAGLLICAPNPWRRMGYAGAIVFLTAITGLGVGAAAPSNLILAGGVATLLWKSRDRAAEELSAG